MSLLVALKLLLVASIVLMVISLALRSRSVDVLYMFHHGRDGLRAFAAMFLVPPLVALAMVMAFELKHEVEVAILVLSLSPVPPLLPLKQLKSGAEGSYIAGLLIAAALVAIVVMPLGLHLFGMVFGREVDVPVGAIIKTLAITIAVPALLGFVAQKLLGAHAARASEILGKVAMVMLLVGALALTVMVAPAMWELAGGGTLLALLGIIVAGLAAGYLLGGPSRFHRAALALASATRHPGVALSVVGTVAPEAKLATIAILMSVLLNLVVGIPFLKILRRKGDAG